MDENYSYLIIPFGEFEEKIKDAIRSVDEILNIQATNENLAGFILAKESWVSSTLEFYTGAFNEKRNWFTTGFKGAGVPMQKAFQIYWEVFKAYKAELGVKRYTLEEALKTISVCDYIRDGATIAPKKGFTVNEKASILLEKLYVLDNNNYYLARMLLVGNAVELKKPNEAIEIAKYLNSKGLVDISHYAGQEDLFLSISTEGKVYYESQTKTTVVAEVTIGQNVISGMTGIFIVHGHNNEMKETVARAVDKIGLEAIILHEKASKGLTVIEKFTEYSGAAQFAVVLLSADDFAYPKDSGHNSAKLRPRQNVVFELGYFVGKLGRERVFCLYETLANFEIHSDFAGVVLEEFDSRGAWKMKLGQELAALGVKVDWPKLMS